jgi:hypothetical protein
MDPALREALSDLQHDLGKYLRLPLVLLPHDADDAAVREAVATALLRTKRSARATKTARAIWADFVAENGDRWPALRAAVERALAWEAAIEGAGPIDRAAAERDLGAVGEVLRAIERGLDDDG